MDDELIRLDALLVRQGLVGGRDRAKELIEQGLVLAGGRPAKKAAQLCPPDLPLRVLAGANRFVSRAGHKLEGGLDAFSIDLTGKVVLDAGASTGGFTQCALERGAALVYAVDVGTGQLSPVLRRDPRVVNLEQTDIRSLDRSRLDRLPDLAVCDLSFISLRQVLPAVKGLLSPEGEAVALIKPQFEAGRGAVGRTGVVRDPRVHLRVLEEVTEGARRAGFCPAGLCPSPIRGGDGNLEFLLFLRQRGEERLPDLAALVRRARAAD